MTYYIQKKKCVNKKRTNCPYEINNLSHLMLLKYDDKFPDPDIEWYASEDHLSIDLKALPHHF